MTACYGDFVLYRPPVKRATWLLWFGPTLLLVGGLSLLLNRIRRQARGGANPGNDDLLFNEPDDLTADHPEGHAA